MKTLNQNHKNFVSFQLRFRIQLIIWVVFLFFDSGTLKNWKNVKLRFSRKTFLLFCFASHGNRTMVYCVEGDNATAEPPMLDVYCFNRLNKNFALHFNFSPNFWIKNHEWFISFEFWTSAIYLSSFPLFWKLNSKSYKSFSLLISWKNLLFFMGR